MSDKKAEDILESERAAIGCDPETLKIRIDLGAPHSERQGNRGDSLDGEQADLDAQVGIRNPSTLLELRRSRKAPKPPQR